MSEQLDQLGASPRRFTHRLVALEEPEVVAALERLAYETGSSVATQVRAAIRYWLQTQA